MIKRKKSILYISVIFIVTALTIGCLNNHTPERTQKGLQPLPASAKILFVSNMDDGRSKEIYSMSEDGDITRITYSKFHHRAIGIDKTGRYIVVTRVEKDTNPPSGLGDEDRKSVWILDLKTGSERRLTDPKNNAEGHSFSPDGKWVVFYMIVAGDRQADIYKIKIDGTNLTRLTKTKDATESDPAWSSDGKRIAFVSSSVEVKRFVLKVMDANGSNVRLVYDCNDNISTPNFPPGVYDPSWSPDDQWIVFEKPVQYAGENGNAGVWHIFKIHPNGTGLVNLSQAGGHTDMAEYFPSFSSDGKYIIFSARYTSERGVQVDIFKMNENGESLKQLTNTESYDDFGVWIK